MLRLSKFLVFGGLILTAAWSQQSYPFFSPSPAPPLIVTATANSPFGQSSYCYWVVVVYPIGKSTPSAPSCISNAIETSSVLISWSAAQGASSYDVLRTTTPILPSVTSSIAVATAVSGTTQTDSFGALSSYTISSAVPATANLYLDNTAFSTPQLRAIVTGVGGTSAFNLGSGGGGTPGGSSGQVQYNNSGAFGGFTVSGDATLNTGTGVLTVGNGAITNAKLANSATTVNGQTCTLGSTCNANAGAAAHSVALNEGAGAAFAAATIGTGGRLLIDQGAAADPSFNALSGDATITNAGVLTVTQVNGAAVPASAKLTSTNAGRQFVAASAETAPITVSATGGIACGTCATTTNGGALSGTAPVTISAAGVIACATCATTTNGGALSATSPATISAAGVIACATCATTTNGGALSATLPVTISAAGVIALNAVTGTGNTVVEQTSPAVTTPSITTGINDANGNSMLAFTPTASAVDGFTFTNGATANPAVVQLQTSGSDANINLRLESKGAGSAVVVQDQAAGALFIYRQSNATNFMIANAGNGNIQLNNNGGTPKLIWDATNSGSFYASDGGVFFKNNTNVTGGATDATMARGAAGLLDIGTAANCATASTCRDLRYRHTFGQGTAPTLTNGTGTITGGDERFRVTLTAAAQTTLTVTFGTAYTTNIPVFVCNDETTAANNPVQAQPTLSTVVINSTGTFGAADKVSCVGGGIIGP